MDERKDNIQQNIDIPDITRKLEEQLKFSGDAGGRQTGQLRSRPRAQTGDTQDGSTQSGRTRSGRAQDGSARSGSVPGGEAAPAADMQEAREEAGRKPLHRQRFLAWGIIAGIVLAGVLIGILVSRNWSYKTYKVVAQQTVDNAISSEYCNLGGNVLRYGTDGASLMSRGQSILWEITYRMDSPKVKVCGKTAVIYDSEGSEIVVCNESGQIGAVTTAMPIVQADVSEQGPVAAMLSDSSNSSWIRYYTKGGEEIAAIKTAINEPGYPMDMALSEDGMLLAVSYLSYADNTMKTLIRFYNFNDIGQNQMDNRVGQFEMEDTLVPEIEYLSGTTAVAFRDDGFTIYEGDTVPEKKQEIKVDHEIESVFFSSRYIGLILDNDENEDEDPFILNVYDLNGKEQVREPVDFLYETVEFSGTQVSFYNRDELCVFGMDGKEKFRGAYEEHPRQFFAIDTKQYVAANEDGITWIRLK